MTDYRALFTDYIVNGAQGALAQVQQSAGRVPEAVRAQAWNLLGYALGVNAAWPQVRQLLLDLTPSMEMAGHRDDWIAFLQMGVQRSVALEDRIVEARLSLAIGLLLRLKNDYPAAEGWLDRAQQGFLAEKDSRGLAAVHNQRGRIHYLQHRDAEAVEAARQALALLSDGDGERAESYFVLGMAALNQRQWENAEENHRRSLEIRQQSGNQRTIAWAMQNLGTVLLQQSEYGGRERLAEAAGWLEQAIMLLQSLPDPFHCAVARNSLALVYLQSRQLEKATHLLCLAEVDFQKTASPEWLARVRNNLGLLYLRTGEAVDAEKSFRSCVGLYTQLGNDADRLNSQHGIVLALLAQARYTEAAALCRQGLADLGALQNTPAQYLEKEGWYRASLAKAEAGMGE